MSSRHVDTARSQWLAARARHARALEVAVACYADAAVPECVLGGRGDEAFRIAQDEWTRARDEWERRHGGARKTSGVRQAATRAALQARTDLRRAVASYRLALAAGGAAVPPDLKQDVYVFLVRPALRAREENGQPGR